jgi:hypothetical protein
MPGSVVYNQWDIAHCFCDAFDRGEFEAKICIVLAKVRVSAYAGIVIE